MNKRTAFTNGTNERTHEDRVQYVRSSSGLVTIVAMTLSVTSLNYFVTVLNDFTPVGQSPNKSRSEILYVDQVSYE